MPEAMRGAFSMSPDSVVSATGRPLRALRMPEGPPPMPPVVPSSTSVFHSPQASQRPAQRVCTVPQRWQTNWIRVFANAAAYSNRSGRWLSSARSKKRVNSP